MKTISIRSSEELNKILKKAWDADDLCAFDGADFGGYAGCVQDSDIKDIFKLFQKAQKQQKDIYEVWHPTWGDIGYFIGTYGEVKKKLENNLQNALKSLEELRKQQEEKELELAESELKAAQKKIKSLKKVRK